MRVAIGTVVDGKVVVEGAAIISSVVLDAIARSGSCSRNPIPADRVGKTFEYNKQL